MRQKDNHQWKLATVHQSPQVVGLPGAVRGDDVSDNSEGEGVSDSSEHKGVTVVRVLMMVWVILM